MSTRQANAPIQVINDWPGSVDRGERKVPTILIYNYNGSLSTWGFMCEDDDDRAHMGKTRREFFKIFLDQETLDAAHQHGLTQAPKNTGEAQVLVTEYLRQIYTHVKETIETQLGLRMRGGWSQLAVEFVFSVPTTWTNLSIINTFKSIICDAGFGSEGLRHNAVIDLTEAEAAAVATVKQSAIMWQPGEIFLSIDAGGGTTDLALMQITNADASFPQMNQISAVKGVGIGASLIDRAFIALVARRLAAVPDIQSQLPPDFPQRMSRSHQFKTTKHKFGERAYTQEVYRIPMEGVSHEFTHPGIGVENARMAFSHQEIQSIFDPQIEGVIQRVQEQLDWMKDQGLTQQVQYMVLSGGLGSSAYVRDMLQNRFSTFPHPNAQRVQILPCTDPQLVVIRGLLLDRQQALDTGSMSVLAARVARASYGVVVQEVYSPTVHFNEDIRPDAYEPAKRFAINQIQWLIRKGDVINPNAPLVKSFEIRVGQNEGTRAWDSEIVVSHNEPNFLPRSLKQAGAVKLCDIKSNLSGVQQHQLALMHKKGTCFSRGYTFYICQFEVRVIVAPADLRFELWFGGQRFAGNHEPIAVAWDQNGAATRPG
ncbi:hypothetical protein MKZ38_003021 [Zalerion maritima]|uniref:Hsp70 family chaperone n=1 Tax=Zalerion maritima TaxID=339359 RepID=A0AAD5RPN2_9PEZI|nr:hypothetical protein MKZ38_003021 [Zalerion maritima]